MSDQEIAAKLEEAAKLLHGAASAFRRGDRATANLKMDEVTYLVDAAYALLPKPGREA